jgi:PTH1 family peptidyl-tRNA hydrolase
MKFSLIIPIHNEVAVIGRTIGSLRDVFDEYVPEGDSWEIIVVDNASTDGSVEVIREYSDPRVRIVELSEKGKGRAVRAGFYAATGDVIGFTDADLSVSPETLLAAFFACATEVPVVVGSRAHPASALPEREWWRTTSSRVFNLMTRAIVGVRVSDTQCPLKVLRREHLPFILLSVDQTWYFDIEFFALLERSSVPFAEIPVQWEEHRYPERKSKLSTVRDGARSIPAMMRIRRRLRGQLAELAKTHHNDAHMQWIIVGLGNPGGEYARTRHNAGRIVLEALRQRMGWGPWEYRKTHDALIAHGDLAGHSILLVEPETYMNASGKSLVSLVKDPDHATRLVVIHDDVDLPLGEWRFAYERGSGGQKGIESIMSTLRTRAFVRVRIGVAPTLEEGKKRKKAGDMVLEKFREEELARIEHIGKGDQLSEALTSLVVDGLELSRSKWKKWKDNPSAHEGKGLNLL